MYGILLSAGYSILMWLIRSVLVKFVVFFALYFIVTALVGVLMNSGLMPNASALNGTIGSIGSAVWYFLDLFNFSVGFSMLISAWTTRFIIRRIPVVG